MQAWNYLSLPLWQLPAQINAATKAFVRLSRMGGGKAITPFGTWFIFALKAAPLTSELLRILCFDNLT